jgi:hypothetical protein
MRSGQEREDLVLLREAPFRLLGEEEAIVAQHVELAAPARDRLGFDGDLLANRGRETRGPRVVAVSGRAVEDPNRHRGQRTKRS